jgi:hypothetical protein
MATVGYQSPYAADIVAVQRVFYSQQWSFACQCLYSPHPLLASWAAIGFHGPSFVRKNDVLMK